MKTQFDSYCNSKLCKGCSLCVQGKKLVLFISGVCQRNCWYCSLSNKRKNKDVSWANERIIKNTRELVKEARESNATSAGITGGDPLLFLGRTLRYAKALKKSGKNFHIHIYLPTELIDENKIRKLEKYIGEFRLHPDFLIKPSSDIEKIKLVSRILGKSRLGIELPMIPARKREILNFILKVKKYISFVNLNEFEASESNQNNLKNYRLNPGGYVIKGSLEAGKWIISKLKREKIKVHLCTAELKNWHQYRNRLKRHKILPFGRKTEDGTVIYFVVRNKKIDGKQVFYDKQKNQSIISPKIVNKIIDKYKVIKVEEFPTYDRLEVETEII